MAGLMPGLLVRASGWVTLTGVGVGVQSWVGSRSLRWLSRWSPVLPSPPPAVGRTPR
jgi:hypothetical protein